MKKILSIILVISMLSGMAVTVNADEDITVTVDGEQVQFDTQPIIEKDRVLVPMRAIYERLGAYVDWHESENTVYAKKEFGDSLTKTITLTVGDDKMRVEEGGNLQAEETIIEIDSPAKIINGRTYVPLRAISEAFGCRVLWYDWLRMVSVQTPAPTSQKEITEQLLKYNIIDEADIDKEEYITVLEALKALGNLEYDEEYGYSVDLSDWYYGDMLASLDYLDDEIKEMLLALSRWRSALKEEELLELDLNSNLTEYKALVYLTRMLGNTYGCTDYPIERDFTEVSQTYNSAVEKGLIDSADISYADEAITREKFYSLLIKAMYTPFFSGGDGGAIENRYIEMLNRRAKRIASATPKPEKKEAERIEIAAEFDDDMSIHWTVPDKYRINGTHISYITENGDVEGLYGSLYIWEDIGADEIIKMISYNNGSVPKAIRCEYTSDEGYVYFDIDLSNIELVTEDYIVEPGVYTPFEGQWVPKYITLADGYKFKKDAYYMIVSYDHSYRLPEYNQTSRM
ncbi:MAG: copper amine oxidase N-terminal domain-containing protein, partial [Clostridia bacterium]|nr:copper amine oxidase N-terminal domain-containing protein [Clostridia bacterium]